MGHICSRKRYLLEPKQSQAFFKALKKNYETNRAELSASLSDLWNRIVQCITVTDGICNDAAKQLFSALERIKRDYKSCKSLSE